MRDREEDKKNGLTRVGGKQCVSNAERKPDRYTGSLIFYSQEKKGGYQKDIKPGGTAGA